VNKKRPPAGEAGGENRAGNGRARLARRALCQIGRGYYNHNGFFVKSGGFTMRTTQQQIGAPVSITEQYETFVREDGSTYTRKDIFVKLYVTFRDAMLARLKGPRLSAYLCIALHCGDDMTSYPSLSTISSETGYSRRAVIAAVNDLVAMGLVKRRKRRTPAGDPDSNLYTVKGYNIGMGEKGGSAPDALPGAPGAPGVVHQVHQGSAPGAPKEEPIKKNHVKERERLSPSFPAGIHRGETLESVLETDPGYVQWAAENWGSDKIRRAARRASGNSESEEALEASRLESLAEIPIDVDEYLAGATS